MQIKTGDKIQFHTCCNADRKTYIGIVEFKEPLGLITVVDNIQYELKKLVDISIIL